MASVARSDAVDMSQLAVPPGHADSEGQHSSLNMTAGQCSVVSLFVPHPTEAHVLHIPAHDSEFSDTSAPYWELYGREARTYDKYLVTTLKGNTKSMVFLVSGDAHRRLHVYVAVSYDCLADYSVLCHRRSIYHRYIQDASTQLWLMKYTQRLRVL